MDAVDSQSERWAVCEVEFFKHGAQMGFDGSFGDFAVAGDSEVGRAVGGQDGDLNRHTNSGWAGLAGVCLAHARRHGRGAINAG